MRVTLNLFAEEFISFVMIDTVAITVMNGSVCVCVFEEILLSRCHHVGPLSSTTRPPPRWSGGVRLLLLRKWRHLRAGNVCSRCQTCANIRHNHLARST